MKEFIEEHDVLDARNAFFTTIGRYPVLTTSQISIAYDHISTGGSVNDLRVNHGFVEETSPILRQRLNNAFEDSARIEQLLVLCNLGLVAKAARATRFMSFEDAAQEGVLALHSAVEGFNPKLGYAFSTYALRPIRLRIGRAEAERYFPIRLPIYLRDALFRANQLYLKTMMEEGIELPWDKLVERLVSTGQADEAVAKKAVSWLANNTDAQASLDVPVSDDSGSSTLLADVLSDPTSEVEDTVVTSQDRERASREIREILLANLNAKEIEILKKRLGLGGAKPMTQEQVGQSLEKKISHTTISLIEKEMLGRLRSDPRLRSLLRDAIGI